MDRTPISAAQIVATVSAGRDAKGNKLPNFREKFSTKQLQPAVLYADRSKASTTQRSDRVYARPPRGNPLYTVIGHTIFIHATDAQCGYWPTKVDPEERGLSWHQPADASIRQFAVWKDRCGQELAKLLGLDNGKANAS